MKFKYQNSTENDFLLKMVNEGKEDGFLILENSSTLKMPVSRY